MQHIIGWLIIGIVGLVVLLLVNRPVFRFIDEMLYGSSAEAERTIHEADRMQEEIRYQQQTNVFNHLEALSEGRFYHADHQRSMTMGEFMKIAVVVVEILFLLMIFGGHR